MNKLSFALFITLLPAAALGQTKIPDAADSLTNFQKRNNLKFHVRELLAPASLMAFGIIGLEGTGLKHVDQGIAEGFTEEKITAEDFTSYVPAAAVYGLNAFGVKGKNNLRDRSIILGTSYLILSVTVLSIKNNTNAERPDGSENTSFPSGHSAIAFASAEFLWQEYRDISVWYGVSGYLVAAGTGALRIYHDRHWLTDVAMGAGIGMLSTKIAYWLYPVIEKTLFKPKNKKARALIAPFYNGRHTGLGLVGNF